MVVPITNLYITNLYSMVNHLIPGSLEPQSNHGTWDPTGAVPWETRHVRACELRSLLSDEFLQRRRGHALLPGAARAAGHFPGPPGHLGGGGGGWGGGRGILEMFMLGNAG